MNKYVLDSSAILAVINLERGYEAVEPLIADSAVSTVNLAEVLSKLVERGVAVEEALDEFDQLGINVFSFDMHHAVKTSELRPFTRHLGLSLGDRACLALAIQESATAITADKNWTNLDVCPIEVIR